MRGSRQRERQERENQKRQQEIALSQTARRTRQTIAQIAEALGETEERQRAQVQRIVETCGVEASLALLEETLRIEAEGGIMTADGARRRTPGGAYLTILKQRLKDEGRKEDLKKIIG
jgi:hypothetical protein